MFGKLLKLIAGYAKVSYSCSYPEGFINQIKAVKDIWDIKKIYEDRIMFSCSLYTLPIIKKAAVRNFITLEVVKEVGFPVFLRKYKQRFGLFIGLILGICLIWLSTLFVWEINIVGNDTIPEKEITKTLSELGFYEGAFIPSINFDVLHNNYLIKENRISWIAINMNGTIAKIEVKKRDIPPERTDQKRTVNIIAKCDGLVERVDVIDGGREVKAGDVVTKGQLLISSFLETRKSGAILRNARGSIYAKTFKSYYLAIPITVSKKICTGKEFNFYSIKILGKVLPFHLDLPVPYKKYDYEFFDNKATIFKKIELPIRIICESYPEFHIERYTMSNSEVKNIALKKLNSWFESELSESEILSKTVEDKNENGYYILICEVECIEDIGEEIPYYLER